MRSSRLFVLLAAVSFGCGLSAQSLFHQRLAVGLGAASQGILNESGHAAFLAAPADGQYYDPWIAGQPFATELLNGGRTCELYALDPSGVLLWGLRQDSLGPYRHVYLDVTDLSAAVGSLTSNGRGAGFVPATGEPVWHDAKRVYVGTSAYSDAILGTGSTSIGTTIVDDVGNIAWSGSGPATGGQRDVFFNSANLSAGVLGSSRFASPVDTAGGKTAWFGYGTLTDGYTDAFVNTTNVSRTALGTDPREAYPKAVTSFAKLLWSGWGAATFGGLDVFLDGTNLSMPLLGNGADRSATPIGMSPTASALWVGQSFQATGGAPVLYLNSTNYSGPILGSGGDVMAIGITDSGLPIWAGTGNGTSGRRNVFRGTVNVTKAAYGGSSRFSFLMAMNRRGQVLWRAEEPEGTITVWLTSPALPTTLTGTILLDGLADPQPRDVVFEFLEPGTGNILSTQSVYVASDGTFVAEPLQTGLFDIRVRATHFVSRLARGVPVCETGSFTVLLPNGDANLDNVVDLNDLSAVLIRFASAGNGDPVDLNEDGTVDLLDISIVLLSFAKTGE